MTREEAAKIIAYLLVGNAKQADALTTTSAPFTDVSAQRWSAGYIAYCVQAGIIDGMGDGTFDPTGKVTGLQFAKMLLCAVGYGAKDEYTGDNWAINTAKDALNLGIFDGNLAGATNTPATREECALYAFNTTVDVKKVTYSSLLGGYIERAIGNSAEANKAKTIAEDYELKSTDADDDAFERLGGHYWYVTKKSNRISAYYGDEDYLVGTYTTPVKGSEIYSLVGATFAKNANVEVYVDGVLVNDGTKKSDGTYVYPNYDDAGNYAITKTSKDITSTGYGVETYVYAWTDDNDDAQIRICIINTYLAEVSKVSTGKDVTTTVKPADATTVENTTFETDEFEKGDLVLLTYSLKTAAIESMELAELVESTIISFTNKDNATYVGTDDTTYTQSATQDVVGDLTACSALNKTCIDKDYTLVLDRFGYLIGVDDVVNPTNYVYVAQFGIRDDTSSTLSYADALVADVYYADGTNEIVYVNVTDYEKGANTTSVLKTAFNGYSESHEISYIKNLNTDSTLGVYILTTRNGKAVLSRTDYDANDSTKEFYHNFSGDYPAISKGVTKMYNVDNNDSYTSSKTVFFYVTGTYGEDDYSVKVYTGITKVPVAKVYTGDDEKKSEAIAVDGFTTASSPEKYVYSAVSVKTNFADTATDGTNVYLPQQKDGKNSYYINSRTKTVEYYLYLNGEETTEKFVYDDLDDAQGAVDHYLELGQVFMTLDSKGGWNTHSCKPNDKVKHNSGTVTEVDVDGPSIAIGTDWYDMENATIVNLTKTKDADTLDGIDELLARKTIMVAYDYDKNNAIGTLYVLDVQP